VALDAWTTEADALRDVTTWERVLKKVLDREMPPENKPQPTAGEREQLSKWIEAKVMQCDCDHPDPGRVTIRRLNRAEYNNTIRDLLGVEFKPAEDFPVDDSGHGFDNIADALSMPPLLIEKYLTAADKVVEAAFALSGPPRTAMHRYPVDALEVGYNARQRGDGWVFLNSIEEDDVALNFETPVAGEFVVRVRAYARQETTNTIKLTFMLGNQPVETVPVATNAMAPGIYETRMTLGADKSRVRAVVRRIKDGLPDTEALKWKKGPEQKGAVDVEWLELQGPFAVSPEALARRKQNVFTVQPAAGEERKAAGEILSRFSRRAYRRPVMPSEVERLVGLAAGAWQRGETFEEGVAQAIRAALVSPSFLFRGSIGPAGPRRRATRPIEVDEFTLASRLSYFLWSSMPDERLFALAAKRQLRRNLESEVKRMLVDPKSRALADNFAGQWLQIRNLDLVIPDRDRFPNFDDELRRAMVRETELLFEHVKRADRSIVDFLNADYTFINDRLAQHYGIGVILGAEFERVNLAGTPRRGVLGHGSVLTLTSNPTRTSPVKRGKWVLETLLNAPPPPPPPEVPELKDGKEITGTLRQRLEQHRADPLCSSCHARMDPIGFSLENFDATGAWREKDGPEDVDVTGVLATGERFTGARELADLLAGQKKEQFVRAFADRMLTFALGRGLEFYDKCALDEIVKAGSRQDYRFSAMVMAIVQSTPFQKERGESPGNSKRP
jgi:hypothetical protein